MKLRHQATLLILLPALCQIVLVAMLWSAAVGLESAGRKEIRAKQILAECQKTEGLLGIRTLQITRSGFTNDRVIDIDCAALLEVSLKELRSLVSDSQKSTTIVERISKNSHLFLARFEELKSSYVPGNDTILFARFLHRDEFFESIARAFNQLSADITTLSNIYGPISEEFNPVSMRARAHLLNVVILMVVWNLALIAVLTFLINRHALERLKTLMANIRTFSGSQKLYGSDELAEIDRAFTEVSLERKRLDDIRKSMTAMVSHDLRSPLCSMMITLDLITELEQSSVTDATLHKLIRVRNEADRLNRLVNTLLDIEKMESGKVEVNLSTEEVDDIIGTAVNTTTDLAKAAKVQLTTGSIDCRSPVRCDKDRTVQVLVNLLSNAIKFSPANSTVSIRAEQLDSTIRIEVIDNGPGVPPENRTQLFGKFSQLDQPTEIKKKGSGLGLYICKMLIEPQSGKIGFDAPEAGGSCFWVELPAAM